MRKVFYFHARLSGGKNVDSGASINSAYGRQQFREQMASFTQTGLLQSCEQFLIGLNGCDEDAEFVSRFVQPNVVVVHHGNCESLLPTMYHLQKLLPKYESMAIGFAHTKGITKPGDAMTTAWRDCMEKHVVHDWRKCVLDLQNGYDAVGCHWLHNSPNDPNANRWGGNSFFGGVFWWSTHKYLATLPDLPPRATDRHSWYLPELWLGNGKPRIKDYHASFPNTVGCRHSASQP